MRHGAAGPTWQWPRSWTASMRQFPVVHADETGWREDGANGYVWTFSTPTERYFLRRGRGQGGGGRKRLGESFSGVLVSDFYAAYQPL